MAATRRLGPAGPVSERAAGRARAPVMSEGRPIVKRIDSRANRAGNRRGITLVEMLVTVAILVLIMTIIVQVFQAATGAVTGARIGQELDDAARLLDSTIRSDLNGATARFTPPLDPNNNQGYFEYGENEFADNQGEDADDYIRFTAKAPPGRPFLGRLYVPPNNVLNVNSYLAAQPITVSSEYAEIIYFLRNGNLYRRVLLVDPTRNLSTNELYQMMNNHDANGIQPTPGALGGAIVSWQGMNDISAHPVATGNGTTVIVANSLGDLSNRENRYASPRFGNDFLSLLASTTIPPTWSPGQDGIPDDQNADSIPDVYPTLYPNMVNAVNTLIFVPTSPNLNANYWTSNPGLGMTAFPYIFPGAYSVPQILSNSTTHAGWIHSPTPEAQIGGSPFTFDGNPLGYLNALNHNPLDLGDNLPTPPNTITSGQYYLQTYWGFPTWRETLSPFWNDPTYPVFGNFTQFNASFPAYPPAQPKGLAPRSTLPNVTPILDDGNTLPAMNPTWRVTPQLFTDGIGVNNGFFNTATAIPTMPLWNNLSWEDDLIMTNVRSFDVKAYDSAYGGYVDLGWGDDLRLYMHYATYANPIIPGAPPVLYGLPQNAQGALPLVWPPINEPTSQAFNWISQTLAHEGRMPPLVEDLRFDAQFGAVAAGTYLIPNGNNYIGNVGDDTPGIVRMRRIWDSWSTKYSVAPANGVYYNPNAPGPVTNNGDPLNGAPWGPPFTPPVYPSYPPPYPAPLRGLQIQIRVADPSGKHVKSLTIRQDFTDKL